MLTKQILYFALHYYVYFPSDLKDQKLTTSEAINNVSHILSLVMGEEGNTTNQECFPYTQDCTYNGENKIKREEIKNRNRRKHSPSLKIYKQTDENTGIYLICQQEKKNKFLI